MKTFAIALMIGLFAVTLGAQARGPVRMKVEAERDKLVKLAVEGELVTGAPYSAEIESESIQTLGDGNRIVKRTTGRVYRDSAGRVRREEDRPSGTPFVQIIDPAKRMAFTKGEGVDVVVTTDKFAKLEVFRKMEAVKKDLEQVRKKIETKPIKEVTKAGVPPGVNATVTEEDLPAQAIEGLRAIGHRRTTVIPAGAIGNEQPITIVSEEWTSPDLKVLLMTRHSDPRTGESTYRLRTINRSEPGPSLFEPPDIRVRTGVVKRPQ